MQSHQELKRRYEGGDTNVQRRTVVSFWYPDMRSRAPTAATSEQFILNIDAGDSYSIVDGEYILSFQEREGVQGATIRVAPRYLWVELFTVYRLTQNESPRQITGPVTH